jgi:hypothetical protein
LKNRNLLIDFMKMLTSLILPVFQLLVLSRKICGKLLTAKINLFPKAAEVENFFADFCHEFSYGFWTMSGYDKMRQINVCYHEVQKESLIIFKIKTRGNVHEKPTAEYNKQIQELLCHKIQYFVRLSL